MWASQRHYSQFILAAAQLRLLQAQRISWQRAPITLSLWLTSWCRDNMGCWADRLEAKAAKCLRKERWKKKWYAANGMGQKGCLFVHPTISKSHQGKCQAREIFILLIHQTRGNRAKNPTNHQQKTFAFLKPVRHFHLHPMKTKKQLQGTWHRTLAKLSHSHFAKFYSESLEMPFAALKNKLFLATHSTQETSSVECYCLT